MDFTGSFILCIFLFYNGMKFVILQYFISCYLYKKYMDAKGVILLHRKIKKGIFVALSRKICKGFEQCKRRHDRFRNGVFG